MQPNEAIQIYLTNLINLYSSKKEVLLLIDQEQVVFSRSEMSTLHESN